MNAALQKAAMDYAISRMDKPCTICGRPRGIFHAELSHSFAQRRKIVQSRRNSENLIHEMLGVFPDLAAIHEPGCHLTKKGRRQS